MLQSRADYMTPWLDQTEDNSIKGIGGIAGENYAIRAVVAEKVADTVSNFLYVVLALHRQVIAAAAGRYAKPGIDFKHLLNDLGRLRESCGCIVQVNHWRRRNHNAVSNSLDWEVRPDAVRRAVYLPGIGAQLRAGSNPFLS
jgi:hypothetical protein